MIWRHIASNFLTLLIVILIAAAAAVAWAKHQYTAPGPSAVAACVRVAPGATIPAHRHERVEHSYILSGSIDVEGTLCRAGDYHRAAAGTHHRGPYSAEGCVILLVESAT